MGKGEFLTNKQIQNQNHEALERLEAARVPVRPPIPQPVQDIITQTKADYEKTFGKPAPELHIESNFLSDPRIHVDPAITIDVNAGNEEQEKLANAIAMRLATSSTAHASQHIIPIAPAPSVVRVLTAEEERQADRDEEDRWDKAYGAQASRNGPM